MINPSEDRLDYGEILSPPPNFRPNFAIGTTYSLDLDALVGASISLNLSEEMDSNLIKNSVYLLRALRESADKIALFCEGGRIHLPSNPTQLYVLLEDTVFQVKTSKEFNKNRFASFHPKFWLLRFEDDDGDFLYRMIILSRNLTFDKSWDISFVMEGKKAEEITDKNNAVIDFIDYLTDFSTNDEKTNIMNEIMEELKYVHFNPNSEDVDDFEFIINGIGDDYSIQNHSLFTDSLDELLIMSPFLSKGTIKDFNSRKNPKSKALLLTQNNSLGSLNKLDCDNFDVYTLKNEIINGESYFSQDSEINSYQDIHAKIYIAHVNNQIDLYLGSLNASHNALCGNVEFMIKLKLNNRKSSMRKLIEDIFNGELGGTNNPFRLVNVEDYEDSDESGNILNLIVKYITRLNPKAEVTYNDNNYDVKITFDEVNNDLIEDKEIFIKPLFVEETCNFSSSIIFKNLDKIDLSEFYSVTIEDSSGKFSSLIKIPTSGMPEDRQKEIISKIITNDADFIIYVAFLLGDDYILSAVEMADFKKKGSKNSLNLQLPELYEKMLMASCFAPEKFKELEFLIESISQDNVVPEDFKKLHGTFMDVISNEFE